MSQALWGGQPDGRTAGGSEGRNPHFSYALAEWGMRRGSGDFLVSFLDLIEQSAYCVSTQ